MDQCLNKHWKNIFCWIFDILNIFCPSVAYNWLVMSLAKCGGTDLLISAERSPMGAAINPSYTLLLLHCPLSFAENLCNMFSLFLMLLSISCLTFYCDPSDPDSLIPFSTDHIFIIPVLLLFFRCYIQINLESPDSNIHLFSFFHLKNLVLLWPIWWSWFLDSYFHWLHLHLCGRRSTKWNLTMRRATLDSNLKRKK